MKNTSQDAKSKIITFLTKNPNSDAKTIADSISVTRTEVFNTMNELSAAKQVSMFQKNAKSVKLFSVVTMPSVEKAKEHKKNTDVEVSAAPASDGKVHDAVVIFDGKNFGRDFSKYHFNGMEFRKGKLALAIVKHVIEKKNPTFKQLFEIFPNEIVRNYGVFTEAATARKMNAGGKQRYFTQASELFKLKCGSIVAVTNQWGSNNIGAMVEIGRAHGCKIVEPTI